jgi:hypothetical protein
VARGFNIRASERSGEYSGPRPGEILERQTAAKFNLLEPWGLSHRRCATFAIERSRPRVSLYTTLLSALRTWPLTLAAAMACDLLSTNARDGQARRNSIGRVRDDHAGEKSTNAN